MEEFHRRNLYESQRVKILIFGRLSNRFHLYVCKKLIFSPNRLHCETKFTPDLY
jgi:hypothetical protein